MPVYLDETIQNYLGWLKEIKKAPYQTFRAYQIDLIQFLKHFLREEQNNIPSKTEIENYIELIKKKYNYSTYRRKITSLRNFIAYLVESGINVPDPLISISLPLPDVNFNLPLTYEEVIELNDSLPESIFQEIRDKLIFSLLAKCGLTVKQLLKVKIKDINIPGRQIIISKNQLAFFDDITGDLLKKYIDLQNQNTHITLEDFLFQNNTKLPLSPRTVNLIVDKLSKKMNFKSRLSPTILRRLFAKSLREKGLNKTTKELILGKKCRLAS